jgi:hypothetical protein
MEEATIDTEGARITAGAVGCIDSLPVLYLDTLSSQIARTILIIDLLAD